MPWYRHSDQVTIDKPHLPRGVFVVWIPLRIVLYPSVILVGRSDKVAIERLLYGHGHIVLPNIVSTTDSNTTYFGAELRIYS